MQISSKQPRLRLPDSLRDQLVAFRRRLWRVKSTEAVCGGLLAVVFAALAMFVLDRVFETPAVLRLALFGAAAFGCAAVPLALYRWVWRRRKLDQIARLLSRKHPSVGDQLLGVIELVQSESEQARSLALCQAAIHQVAEAAGRRDFSDAIPTPRHRRRALLAAAAAAVAGALLWTVPDAATNAWSRLLAPWRDTPRYTFARLDLLPDPCIVAHGEAFTVTVRLAESTRWRPDQAEARVGDQPAVTSRLVEGAYRFDLPAQIDLTRLSIRAGDFRQRVRLEPTLRPELVSVTAEVSLPDYLGRPAPSSRDVRGGAISMVQGSRVAFVATASRELSEAQVDGQAVAPEGARITAPTTTVSERQKVEIAWKDRLGLSGKAPFTLSIVSRDDEPPSLTCEDLPRQRVVLDSEVLSFKVKAQDDFGVKLVGMDWQGIDTIDPSAVQTPAKGERALAAGGYEKSTLDLEGTFSAKGLGIAPQPIQLRIFVEDYFPGRERVYSPTYVLYVLDAEQHAIWLTEMLSKWHHQSLEVRDREMQLFETNKLLRALTPEELDLPDTRKRIETQASAERANGRRLSGLVATGEDLIRQATRNPEFGVEHLEKWAEMLQILKDISGNRMPSVADLLKQAAQAPSVAGSSPSPQGPMAGQIRAAGSGSPSTGSPGAPKSQTPVPTLVDVESSQQPPPETKSKGPSPGGKSSPRLGLAQTMLMGASKGGGPSPAGGAMDDAISKQQDLLAEFEKVADELNRILGNLEGSTLVKRLKAASRLQARVATKLDDEVTGDFGRPAEAREQHKDVLVSLSGLEAKSSSDVSVIMDDMLAYFERRRLVKFRDVLDEMRKKDVVGNLRQLGDDLRKEHALSVAQCEYWSDHLDRWAENLVDPSGSGC